MSILKGEKAMENNVDELKKQRNRSRILNIILIIIIIMYRLLNILMMIGRKLVL